MTLQDLAERRRIRRKQQPSPAEAERRRQERERKVRESVQQHPDRVLTFQQWLALNTLSKASGMRIKKRGELAFVQLGPRRLGVKESENRRWQQSREIAR
jgi:predicted DNA-binding transcriptional regulator AlpA